MWTRRFGGGWLGLGMLCCAAVPAAAAASPHREPADLMVRWLVRQQHLDGSFGLEPGSRCLEEAVRPLCTLEALRALDRLAQRGLGFQLGLAWLKNHAVAGNDLIARQIQALGGARAETAGLLAEITRARAGSGWGLDRAYRASVLDSAVVTASLVQTSIPGLADTTSYLVGRRLADGGWALGQGATRQVLATAAAVEALAARASADPAAAAALPGAVAALEATRPQVTNNLSRALMVRALLEAGAPATTDLALLLGQQNRVSSSSLFGSIGGDLRVTAITAQALAVLLRRDIAQGDTTVDIPDARLRAVVNETLGKGAMDRLDRAELARLTSLDASRRGIGRLDGLEWAVNLATCNLAHNQLTTTLPIDRLPCRGTANLAGNPLPGLPVVSVPAVPLWLLCASLVVLGLLGARRSGARRAGRVVAGLATVVAVLLAGPSQAADPTLDDPETRQALSQVARAVLVGRSLEAKALREVLEAEREALQPIIDELGRLEALARVAPVVAGSPPTAAAAELNFVRAETVVTADTATIRAATAEELAAIQASPADGESAAVLASPASVDGPMGASTQPGPAAPTDAGPSTVARDAPAGTAASEPAPAAPSPTVDFATVAPRLEALRARLAARIAAGDRPAPAQGEALAQAMGSAASPDPGLSRLDRGRVRAVLQEAAEAIGQMLTEGELDVAAVEGLRERLSDQPVEPEVATPPPIRLPDPTLTTRTEHVPVE